MRGHRDLRRVTALAVLGAVVAIVLPWELVRIVVALPLGLFLPGYAIVSAAFARTRLNGPQEVMIALATSLAVLALGGLLLTYLPGGIRTASWSILLLVVVVGGCRAAALRRPASRYARDRRPLRSRLSSVAWVDLACGALATAIAAAALVLAYTPLSAGKATGFTALWMLPGQAEESHRLLVGVRSSEHDALRYRLEVHSPRLGREVEFSLAPGDERVASLPLPAAGRRERVEATLFRADRPGVVYRKVALWVPEGTGR